MKGLTADDLWTLPPDGLRHELVHGELRTMTPAGSQHGAIVGNITVPLGAHVKAARLGLVFGAETGFTIAADTVRAPDVAFVTRARLERGLPPGFFEGPPDLAVEVLSPSDTVFDVEEKVEQWLAAGTHAVWVVNPRTRCVTVHRGHRSPVVLTVSDSLDGGDLIPGFTLLLSELFTF